MVHAMKSVRILVLGLALTLSIAGCSEVLTGGKVEHQSYPPITPAAPLPPGSYELPTNFPTDIPVVMGRYREGAPTGPSTVVMDVTDVEGTAAAEAKALLLAADYQEETIVGQPMYIGTKYMVALTSDTGDDGRFVLTYMVTTLSGMPGLPQIPELTIPHFF